MDNYPSEYGQLNWRFGRILTKKMILAQLTQGSPAPALQHNQQQKRRRSKPPEVEEKKTSHATIRGTASEPTKIGKRRKPNSQVCQEQLPCTTLLVVMKEPSFGLR